MSDVKYMVWLSCRNHNCTFQLEPKPWHNLSEGSKCPRCKDSTLVEYNGSDEGMEKNVSHYATKDFMEFVEENEKRADPWMVTNDEHNRVTLTKRVPWYDAGILQNWYTVTYKGHVFDGTLRLEELEVQPDRPLPYFMRQRDFEKIVRTIAL